MKKYSIFLMSVLLSFITAPSNLANSAKINQNYPVIAAAVVNQDSQSSLKELAYKIGYKHGKIHSNLSYFLKDNEKKLKEEYMGICCREERYSSKMYLPEKCVNNRELYQEFRRGFLKAFEDKKNAMNAL